MLNNEQKEQFNTILEELGKALDISKTEYEAAVQSYNAVANHLTRPESSLAPYKPDIIPHGSFMIGTITKPVVEGDDIDIDLVCQLTGKQVDWTQEKLKIAVGEELSKHKVYDHLMEKPDGRRCWTLRYRENAKDEESKYHMDILPSVVDQNYQLLYENAFSKKGLEGFNTEEYDELAIRITDNQSDNYYTETDHHQWLKSNPFGYAKWFEVRSAVKGLGAIRETRFLSEWVKPVPDRQKEKLPLQRVVQILKRHRDIFYKDRDDLEDKPISIIITTLAARAYDGEADILEALRNVVPQMLSHIQEDFEKVDIKGRVAKLIINPVNPEENFADKWIEHPQRRDNFYEWHKQLEEDLEEFLNKRGLAQIEESLSGPFGKNVVQRAFSNYGEHLRRKSESGDLYMNAGLGMLGSKDKKEKKSEKVKKHTFHGKKV